MFADDMPLTIMRDNIRHRQGGQLFNDDLHNFVSHIDYLYKQRLAALKIPDTWK